MNNQITIREAITENDAATFWEQLYIYFKRDLFPDPKNEEREYFLGDEYSGAIRKIHGQLQDRCYYLFFHRNGQDIGLALPVIYNTEDGKLFIMEFCVYPEFRGNGTGRACAAALLYWAEAKGALYSELNYGGMERRLRFWKSMGFLENGADEWGDALLMLPPKDEIPIAVKVLSDPEDWQLKKLKNGFLREVGEPALTEEKQERLSQAIRDHKITFLIAYRGSRAVGMCSVAACFSTFACADIGMFDDFYIEPVFRKKGIARKLVQAAQEWCKEHGLATLSVCCAQSDEGMYQNLGVSTRLGASFVYQKDELTFKNGENDENKTN